MTIELVNLLGDWLRAVNVVSIDPTGQNYSVTHRWRAKFSDVQSLNPFHLHGGADVGCNPLLSVTCFEDAMLVAEALLEVKPDAREPFWGESAQGLVAGVVLAVVRYAKARGETPTLAKVREILTTNIEGFAKEMEQRKDFQLRSLLIKYQNSNRTIDSIKLHADNATKWLLSEEITKSLSVKEGEGISWPRLKTGKKPLSVYLILDADKLITFAPWLKLMVVSALNTLYRMGNVEGRKTLFMLSEFASYGRVQPIITALGAGRKYGCRLAPIVIQDSGQLEAIYGKASATTVIGNAGALLAFAPAPCDRPTAEMLSAAGGSHWVKTLSASNDPQGGPARINYGMSLERIWPADQICALPEFHALVYRSRQAVQPGLLPALL